MKTQWLWKQLHLAHDLNLEVKGAAAYAEYTYRLRAPNPELNDDRGKGRGQKNMSSSRNRPFTP